MKKQKLSWKNIRNVLECPGNGLEFVFQNTVATLCCTTKVNSHTKNRTCCCNSLNKNYMMLRKEFPFPITGEIFKDDSKAVLGYIKNQLRKFL